MNVSADGSLSFCPLTMLKFSRFVWRLCSAHCRLWSHLLWTVQTKRLEGLLVPSHWRSFWNEPLNMQSSFTASQRSPSCCLWVTERDKPKAKLLLGVCNDFNPTKFLMRICKQSTSRIFYWMIPIFRRRCSFHSEVWICMFPAGPCVLQKQCLCLKVKSNRFLWVPLMASDEIHCNRVTFC